jgi:CheY-like chemotaxis protein
VLGGEIAVKSKLAVGSTFTLYLPLSARPAEARPQLGPGSGALPRSPVAAGSAAEAATLPGKKILVVEDDARNLYAVTSLLEHAQAIVVPATSAREAFARLREHPDVDVVLMDIMMPDVDGYEATRRIRSMTEFSALPVIALTAKASETDRAQCLEAGCTDYVVKPADTRQLVAAIARNLRKG